jgi:hypothetical protein
MCDETGAVASDMNRLLFAVPHYYRPHPESDIGSHSDSPDVRAATIRRTLEVLHETFGDAMSVHPERRSVVGARNVIDVVVVTTGGDHLLAEIGDAAKLATHVEVDVEPMELGFAAHRILADAKGRYDSYGYMEDDILIRDPLLFAKQHWFNTTYGTDALLQPNRYEASGGLKVYPDGPVPPEATAGLSQPSGPARLEAAWCGLDLVFERPSNPHSGCFFLDQEQLERLAAHPRFGVPHVSFVRTLETAASGPVAETFRIYKPAPPTADFLEVEHQGSHYLELWGVPSDAAVAEAARLAADARADRAEVDLAALQNEMSALQESKSWRLTAPLRDAARAARRQR